MTTDISQDSVNELIELKKYLTTRNIIKAVFGTLISFGAAGAVIAIMRNPIKAAHGLAKLMMGMGVFTLGCKAGQIAEDHFKEVVDAISDSASELKQEFLTEGENKDADTKPGRDSKQQPEKSTAESTTRETPASTVWWRRRGKKKAT